VRVGGIVGAQGAVVIVVLGSLIVAIFVSILPGIALRGCRCQAGMLVQILQPRCHDHEGWATRLAQHGLSQTGGPGFQ